MHSQHKYKDENGKLHQLKMNAVNSILYSSVGAVYTRDMNAYCAGEKSIRGNQVRNDLVVMKSLQITIRNKVNLRFHDEHTVNSDTGVLIPCTMQENSCTGDITTYAWKSVETRCNFVHLKNAVGKLTENNDFISSTENIYIHLEGGGELQMNVISPNIELICQEYTLLGSLSNKYILSK